MPEADVLERLDAAADSLSPDELQHALTALLRAYAQRIIDAGGAAPFPPFTAEAPLTATEALLVAGEILRAAEISSFELASMLNI
jgi:hypothetical protein